MLSLDNQTAQKHLDILNNYCQRWGIEVNLNKTEVMIMGEKSNNPTNSLFHLGHSPLNEVDEYCYLGVVLHKSGNLKIAQDNLKSKAMRAFFGLKRTVNRSKLNFRAKTTLFDSLIKPIVLYGAPVWLPTSPIIKHLTNNIKNCSQNITKRISNIESEKVHLSFLRWALGVHRKASIIGCWGETGRYPLIYQSIKLTLKYYQRVDKMKPGSIVHAALQEQKHMNLPWYQNIESLLKLDEIFHLDHVTAFKFLHGDNDSETKTTNAPKHSQEDLTCFKNHKIIKPLPSKKFRLEIILKNLKDHFKLSWDYEKKTSTKLSLFYGTIKTHFEKEQYLDLVTNASYRFRTSRLRISAHDLEIEYGRYKNIPREQRICKWCKLTLNENRIENEHHLLFECDLYASLRSKLIQSIQKSHSLLINYENIANQNNTSNNLLKGVKLSI